MEEIEVFLEKPIYETEKTALEVISKYYDMGSVMSDFGNKMIGMIPELSILEIVLGIEVDDIMSEEKLTNNQNIRLEVSWSFGKQAMISLLALGGVQIADEIAEKIFRKLIDGEKLEIRKIDENTRVVFADTTFDRILEKADLYGGVRFVKKNAVCENEMIIYVKDRYPNEKVRYFINVTELNGTIEGLELAEYLARLSSNYIVRYCNIHFGDGKWRDIPKNRIKQKLARLTMPAVGKN